MNDSNFHPEMLTLARNSRGMTKGRLADLVNISGTAIGRLEAGTLAMTDGVLERVCDALDYGKSFFLRNPVLIGQVGGAIFHRKQQSLSVKNLYRAHALAEVRRLENVTMMRSVDNTDRLLPEYPVDLYDDDPEAIARSVRAVMNLPPGPIFNLTQVLERNGCVVVAHDFQSRQIDGFSQRDQYPPGFIHLNADLPPDRWRWTLAHELGHLVMHFEPTASPKEVEQQANLFAGEFLAPGHEIGHQLEDLSFQKLGGLKRQWGISMQALVNRAYHLNTITASQRQTMFVRLSKAGYRTREPATLDPPVERPGRMVALARAHLGELCYTRTELQDLLGLRDTDFRRHYDSGEDILESLGIGDLLDR